MTTPETLKILIIDDDDVDRMTVRRALKQAVISCSFQEASTGAQGLELLRGDSFDCAFCDYLLPDGDGLSVLRQARAAGLEVPFVMLTGHGDERLAVEVMQAGANDYLPKGKMTPESLARSLTHARRIHEIECERREAQRQLEESNRRITDILESISDAFFALSSTWHLTYLNKQAELLLLARRDDVLGKIVTDSLPKLAPWFRDSLQKAMLRKEAVTAEGYDPQLGSWFEVQVYPRQDGISVYFRDITARKQAEERLSYLANFDALTSLPNRSLLMDRLTQALTRLPWQTRIIGVMFIDLDRFKLVNDTLGHSVGDHLLKEMSQRLTSCVRSGDTVARLGGDEFVILLTDLAPENHVDRLAQKIIDTAGKPLVLQGQEVYVTASVGIALYPTDGETADALLAHADAAMYRAKQQGKNTYQFYSPAMDPKAAKRFNLERNMRRAVDSEEFGVHYQPLVDLRTNQVVSAEALVRWRDPESGSFISPADFLPLAEETGLILPLGNFVLRDALTQAKAWHAAGHTHMRVAVNLSNRQFRDPELLHMIRAALEDTSISATALELELTEEIVMANFDNAMTIIEELRAMGVRLAIDDFGTGYSSLGQLKRFPIHTVKIDRSFICELTTRPDDAAITEAIIAMAHRLGLEVVAEGVETAEQRAFLQRQGCDFMQGYFFSKPVPAADFSDLLRLHDADPALSGT